MRAGLDPTDARIGACGKGRFGVQVARRGGLILLAALAIVAGGVLLALVR
jgi:hypothetical protein